MVKDAGKVVIIGGGIAGLCAAVYAQKCGYQTEVLEMHNTAGGLATSWRRGAYTFETCLHWLLGSKPGGQLRAQWEEVFDIEKLTFLQPEEFVCLETEHGEVLHIYSNIDRLEAELLQHAPEDAAEIRHFTFAVRSLTKFELPDPSGGLENWRTYLHDLRLLPLLRELSNVTSFEYGQRFKNPLLRRFFGEGDSAQLSAIALFLSLAWMSERNAGYAIGGSQAIIQSIAHKLAALGGRLRLGCKVEKILVQDGEAIGVRLTDGEIVAADWIISAADGHATLYDLLGGSFVDAATENVYRTFDTFPSYLQVSLGIAQNLSQKAGFVIRVLDSPFQIDPSTSLTQISFRFFHFDPTFSPPGKTAVTCFLPTRDFEYWLYLKQNDHITYQDEKNRVAEAVMGVLERMIPGVRSAIEVLDVSTPATVIGYTGNWRGSMEGWLITPQTGFRQLPSTLPGLGHFIMIGQWVMPGGGLPSGLLTARAAVKAMCREDHIEFLPEEGKVGRATPTPTARPTSASSAAH
jgi:phytoene dehydrogenase-like protein